jgi:hypothetical protein
MTLTSTPKVLGACAGPGKPGCCLSAGAWSARWGAHEAAVAVRVLRARSQCRFVLPLIHFIPDTLLYSVLRFLKR